MLSSSPLRWQLLILSPDSQQSGQERVLVPQISTIGRHWENGNDYKMQIEGDHRTLVKFSRADTSQYQRVKGVLEARMERNPWETVRHRFSWGLRDVPPGKPSPDSVSYMTATPIYGRISLPSRKSTCRS